MTRRMRWLCVSLTLLMVCVFASWGQYDSGSYSVHLQFSGHLTTAGSCQQLSNTHIKCQVSAGTEGRLQLQATVTPTSKQVNIGAVSLPGWARFAPSSGLGSISGTCMFTPPSSAAGTSVQLVFRASVPGTPLIVDLTVTLDVARGVPPSYGPYSGITDGSGRISVLIPWMEPLWYIAGTLMECPEQILAYTPVSVKLVPKWTGGSISSAQDIGSVIVASSGYAPVTVGDLSFTSSMDLQGKTTGTVRLGYFCFARSQEQTLTGVTDGSGRISVLIPWMEPLWYIAGTLMECPERMLADTSFSLTLMPKWTGGSISSIQDIGSVIVSSSGYADVAVGDLSHTSSMDLWGKTTAAAHLGYFCLERTGADLPGALVGTTDSAGGFTLNLPWPGMTVSGTLSICDGDMLVDQAFSVSLVPSGDAIATGADIAGFMFSAAGYADTTITQFSRISIFGMTSYTLEDVCLEPWVEDAYLDPGVGEIGEGVDPCTEDESSTFTVPDSVNEAFRRIREDIEKAEDDVSIVKGVELALEPTKTIDKETGEVKYDESKTIVYVGGDWDSKWAAVEEAFGKEVRENFCRCHAINLDQGTATLKPGTAEDLLKSVATHVKDDLRSLRDSLKQWQDYLNNKEADYSAHCGKCHDPCECFEFEAFSGAAVPRAANKLNPPYALTTTDQPLSAPFLEEIAEKGGGFQAGNLIVPKGGWLALRAVGREGLHKYELGGTTTDCCWTEREFGAFVQVFVTWRGESKADLLERNGPPHKTASGDFTRKEWLSGVVELGAYQTYSWTPSGYLVQLHNLAAQAQLGGMTISGLESSGVAGAVLTERREDWVVWFPPPDAKTGDTAELLLLINGVECPEAAKELTVTIK